MLELKKGVKVIRVRDYYYFVSRLVDGSVQIERFGECWRVDTLLDFVEAIGCTESDLTQYTLTAP